MKAELKGLPKDLAAIVGAHIVAAGELIDVDPDLAFRHAEAARRRAGRLPMVREAAAETAYASGRYDIALREFRALRRMNGGDELLPAMADCERALGRPRDALELLASLDPATKDVALRIECLLVEAGIRDDLGQRGEALRLLKAAIGRRIGPDQAQARLRYAYANLLEAGGDTVGAREWFEAAAKFDSEAELDVADRIATLEGVTLPDTMIIDEDEDDAKAADAADASMAAEAMEEAEAEPVEEPEAAGTVEGAGAVEVAEPAGALRGAKAAEATDTHQGAGDLGADAGAVDDATGEAESDDLAEATLSEGESVAEGDVAVPSGSGATLDPLTPKDESAPEAPDAESESTPGPDERLGGPGEEHAE